jgi:hypothetical protein
MGPGKNQKNQTETKPKTPDMATTDQCKNQRNNQMKSDCDAGEEFIETVEGEQEKNEQEVVCKLGI